MDKFEKLIKQAVEGHEMPFNPQAWENVSKELGSGFDQMMKESTNGYEAPYNPAAWEAVSSQLGPNYTVWKWIAGTAAVVTAVIGSVYLFGGDSNELANNDSNQSSEIAHNSGNTTVNDNHSATITDLNETNTNNSTNGSDNTEVIVVDNSGNNITPNNSVVNPVNTNVGPNNNIVDPIVNNTGGPVINNGGTPTVTNSTNEIIEYHADASFISSDDAVCVKGKCTFTPALINSDLIYIWNFGDGSMAAEQIGTHKYTKAGEYIVTLEIKHPKTNKTIASSKEVMTVNALPETDYSFVQSSEAIPTVSFTNKTENVENVMWNVKGLKQSPNPEFEYTFRKAGTYSVGLTATNEYGCSKTIEKSVKIDKDYNLLAPNAFAPDGDGDNDNFIPLALKIMDVEFTMTIMDKSGRQVYVTQNAFSPWDGRCTSDNTMAPSGSSYIWRVVLTNANGEPELYEGQVFVVY